MSVSGFFAAFFGFLSFVESRMFGSWEGGSLGLGGGGGVRWRFELEYSKS